MQQHHRRPSAANADVNGDVAERNVAAAERVGKALRGCCPFLTLRERRPGHKPVSCHRDIALRGMRSANTILHWLVGIMLPGDEGSMPIPRHASGLKQVGGGGRTRTCEVIDG